MIYHGKGPKYRSIGVRRPELYKLHIALWWLYVTLDWQQSPYRKDSRCLKIFVVVE